MRLFLVVLMFALLPLQFSAAASAKCCGHPAVAQASPNQHHQPIHLPVVQGAQESASGASGASGGVGFAHDCGVCHAHCAAAVTAAAATMVEPAGFDRVEHLVEPILPRWHKQPYRPQWSAPRSSGLHLSV